MDITHLYRMSATCRVLLCCLFELAGGWTGNRDAQAGVADVIAACKRNKRQCARNKDEAHGMNHSMHNMLILLLLLLILFTLGYFRFISYNS